LRSIPIFALTSCALSGEEQKARTAGCDEYGPKPYSPRQLLAKIRQSAADPDGYTLLMTPGAVPASARIGESFDRHLGQPIMPRENGQISL
jgi:hypothetical protein